MMPRPRSAIESISAYVCLCMRHMNGSPVHQSVFDARPFNGTMRAMVLDQPPSSLREARLPLPFPGEYEILLRVTVCGVCRTNKQNEKDKQPPQRSPLVPGHEVVGVVV